MNPTMHAAAAVFALVLASSIPGGASAQAYPTKPVRLLVTYAAGGASDIVSRVVAAKLSESLGQQVVVDNRPGASGILASELLIRSTPDGHTLIHVNVAHGANPALYAKLPYDTAKDFAPVALLALLPTILVTHPTLPASSVRELIALVKAKPGSLNYASAGIGSANHLAMELFMRETGIDATHVPYKGGGPAIADLLGGQIPMMFITIPPALPHAKAGKLRVLVVSSAKRAPTLPDVPTPAESGIPAFEFNEWQAILTTRGTPRATVAKLSSEIGKVLALPDVSERMAGLGAVVAASTPEQLASHIAAELARWPAVIKSSGMSITR
jgi:tripartite-type tricarboxylate transporter receptor subunit TctC